jgi:phage terminase small subunit
MTRGRKPKPPHLRKAEGQPGHRPLPRIPRVSPLSDLPEPPSELSEAGKRAWRVVGGSLAAVGALEEAYLPMLHMFAQAATIADRAWTELQESGALVRPGRERGADPRFRIWRDSVALARSLGEDFGASPASIARLGLTHVRGISLQQELKAKVREEQEQEQE